MTDSSITDAMVEAAQTALGHEAVYVGASTVRRALSAALAHPGQVREIAIKPLEWERNKAGSWYAASPLGTYLVNQGRWWRKDRTPLIDVGDDEDAKSAAQSDYEQRIRSALALPLPVQEPGELDDKAVIAAHLAGPVEYTDEFGTDDTRKMIAAYFSALSPSPSIPEEKGGTAESVVCPCTTFEQDEDCSVGYPSMLCSACAGTGNAPMDKVVALAAEMMKVAEQVGELEDPFAAWESIDLIKTQMAKASAAKPAIDAALTAMKRCVHDGGFDREIGPIGCGLGDKCVCIGVYPKVLAVADALRASPTEGQTVKEGSPDE